MIKDEYKEIRKLREDSVYKWLEARHRRNGSSVVLQIPQPDISFSEIKELSSYFQKLKIKSQRNKNLLVPELFYEDYQLVLEYPSKSSVESLDYRLVLVYPSKSVESLEKSLNDTPTRPMEWWQQASEMLHFLHNADLVHGHVTLDCFIVADETLYLTNFGYAPLLKLHNRGAIQECSEFLAPEIVAGGDATSVADIYAFAKTVAQWQPKLKDTLWYRQATESNPDKRLQPIRVVFEHLEKAYELLGEEKTEPEKTELEKTKDSIVSKYTLSVIAEPSTGGTIDGGGLYVEDEVVNVKVTCNPGWQFDRWSGELNGSEKLATLKINQDITVVAHFTEEPSSKTVGYLKSVVAVLLGGLVPSWNLAIILVSLNPDIETVLWGVSISIVGVLGIIWGFTVLRQRSWNYILLFGGLGFLISFAILFTELFTYAASYKTASMGN